MNTRAAVLAVLNGDRLVADRSWSIASAVLTQVPDGWAKIDGEWVRITSNGVGYGEFDRDVEGT